MRFLCHTFKMEDCVECSGQAKYECLCKEATQKFCENCLPKHIMGNITLTHHSKMLNGVSKHETPSFVCSICEKKPAEMICLCQGIKTKLCQPCTLIHFKRHPENSHPLEPLKAEEFLNSPADLQDYLNRKQMIDFYLNELRGNITHLEKFNESLETSREFIKEEVDKTFDGLKIQAGLGIKRFGELIANLDSVRYRKELDESEWADNLIKRSNLNNMAALSKDFKVFSELNSDSTIKAIQNIGKVRISINQPQYESKVCYFKPRNKEITVLNLEKSQIFKNDFPVNLGIKDGGSWCDIGFGKFVYAGGLGENSFSNSAFVYDSNTNESLQLPDMTHERAVPGIHHFNKIIFVFGGYLKGESLKSGEYLDMTRNE